MHGGLELLCALGVISQRDASRCASCVMSGAGIVFTAMRMGMWRKISTWSVALLGLLLAVWGGFAMWTGWPIIQVERGWGLFIAGAAALAGGVTTFGLGQVLARLDALLARQTPHAGAAINRPVAQAPVR